MAWATVIITDAQRDYRLQGRCGCDQAVGQDVEPDAQAAYRLGTDLAWIGSGLGEVGLVAGEPVDVEAARRLLDGAHPLTGEVVHAPKQVPGPLARLAGAPYVAAVRAAAEQAGLADPGELFAHATARKRWERLCRGVLRDGEAHTVPLGDLEALATAAPAGPGLAEVYEARELARADRNRTNLVPIGIRGIDLVVNLPKSVSVLYGLADTETAAQIETEYLGAVRDAVTALEGWAAYGVTGHHGDGQTAQRVESSGHLGWTMLHRTARPVDAGAGDPHLHAHVVLAHMVKCVDGPEGTWRAPGSGGRDLHRHVPAVGQLALGLLRQRLSERFGVQWERAASGEWEVAGIPEEVRAEFSRRSAQVTAKAGQGASREQQRAAAAATAKARPQLEDARDARAQWTERAAALVDVAGMLAAAMPGPNPGPTPTAGPTPGPASTPGPAPGAAPLTPDDPDLTARVAGEVWDPATGLTAGTKAVTRAQVLAAVAAATPALATPAQLEAFTDAVIAAGPTVPVREVHASHHSNTARYTTRDIVAAETEILEAARTGRGADPARVGVSQAWVVLERLNRGARAAGGPVLSVEQRAAVKRLTCEGNAVEALVGPAGAGKTTLMRAAKAVWDSQGLVVEGASTAAVAAAGLRAETGMPAATIAALLQRLGPQGTGALGMDVLVVDEAAMVDDRALAKILGAAHTQDVKVVMIGDHLQLRAVGVGGGFKAVHTEVNGVTLSENYRQKDAAERAALETWRAGGRSSALAAWAEAGRVHAPATPAAAKREAAAAYLDLTAGIVDPHERVRSVLLMAATNADVDDLNARVRAQLRADGQLPEGTSFARAAAAGGGTLDLALGDLVRVRRNDYRSRHSTDPDVLNGYRGVVIGVDGVRGARVQWRTPGSGHTESAWITPAAIARGDLAHAYATTVASAQGQTCQRAILYGAGADAHVLYPGLSRAKDRTDLWVPLNLVEDPQETARLGKAKDEDERVRRAVAALGKAVATDRPDELIGPDVLDAAPRPGSSPRASRGKPWPAPKVGREHIPGRGTAPDRLTPEEITRRAAATGPRTPTLTRRPTAHEEAVRQAAYWQERTAAAVAQATSGVREKVLAAVAQHNTGCDAGDQAAAHAEHVQQLRDQARAHYQQANDARGAAERPLVRLSGQARRHRQTAETADRAAAALLSQVYDVQVQAGDATRDADVHYRHAAQAAREAGVHEWVSPGTRITDPEPLVQAAVDKAAKEATARVQTQRLLAASAPKPTPGRVPRRGQQPEAPQVPPTRYDPRPGRPWDQRPGGPTRRGPSLGR